MIYKQGILIVLLTILSCCVKAQLLLPLNNGTFCLDKEQTIGTSTFSPSKNMVIKDLDGDGYKDVAFLEVQSGMIKLYKSNGFGANYTATTGISVTGSLSPYNSIAGGDMNGDGDIDLLICNNNNITIFKNVGNFNFVLAATIPISTNYVNSPAYIAVDDINNDFNNDILLVTSHINLSYGVAVLAYRNTNPSSLTFSLDYQNLLFYGSNSLSLNKNVDFTFGDINNDGKNEIIFSYPEKMDTLICLANISSVFSLNFIALKIGVKPFTPNYAPLLCEAADINNDNYSDVIVQNLYATSIFAVTIYMGQASSTFSYSQSFITPSALTDFKIQDINDDGYKDFIGVTNTKLLVYLYNGATNQFNTSTPLLITLPNGIMAEELVVTDFDKNTLNDIFIKTWKGNVAVPYVIPNFSHHVAIDAQAPTICSTNAATLNAVTTVSLSIFSATNTPVYCWYATSNSSVVISNAITYTTITLDTYKFILKYYMPYSGAICNRGSDTLQVQSGNTPTISVLSSSNKVCLGNSVSFSATGANTYTWLPNVGSNTITAPSFTTNVYSALNYTVIGEDNNGCKNTQTISVNLYQPSLLPIIASNNNICIGDSITLTYNESVGGYIWSNGANTSSIIVRPLANTTYSLTYKDGNSCYYTKAINITLNPNCDKDAIYNAFTPNGDGINDFFYIEKINIYKNNNVIIYNRWGQQIADIDNYDNLTKFWPSREEAPALVSTTYFYVIDLGDGSKLIKGWLEILKD